MDPKTADSLLTIHNALADENKRKMEDMMNSGVESFMKVLNYSEENLENENV